MDFPSVYDECNKQNIEPRPSLYQSWLPSWCPSSPEVLREAELSLLSYIKKPFGGRYIDSGSINGTDIRIWTIKVKCENSKKDPLVMIHGMAAGLALFSINANIFSKERDIYLLDLPGFARSTRPRFSTKPVEAEEQYVNSLEEWRKQVGLSKFYLLGHSFGGYLSCAYAIKHPESVKHLILADPWGMPMKPSDMAWPWYIRTIASIALLFNPLSILRASGPFGYNLIGFFRPDLISRFKSLFNLDDTEIITKYLYHCNVHYPSGEAAFSNMTNCYLWAKRPMISRLKDLNSDVPLTVLYGRNSWLGGISEEELISARDRDAYARIKIVEGAGHHIYADNLDMFTEIVNEAFKHSEE